MTIPAPATELPSNPIPFSVVEIPQPIEDPESKPLLISFEKYNCKECGLDSMDNKRARKALQIVRDVGIYVKTEDDFKKKLPKLEVIPIGNTGDYRKLYKGLADVPDVEIKEVKVDRDKGRLFFFLIDRIFHVVSITDSHYETEKQRR